MHRWKVFGEWVAFIWSFVNVERGGLIGSISCSVNVCTVYTKCTSLHGNRNSRHSEVPRPCLRSLRFLRPKMRTLEKMSTRFPLQSPLFLLGLFLRRLVEGRSKCCSRACLFCLISPLAIAAAMAQNVTTAQVQSAHRAQTTQTAASRSSCHGPMVTAECSVMSNFNIGASIFERWVCFLFVQALHDNCHVWTAVIITRKNSRTW